MSLDSEQLGKEDRQKRQAGGGGLVKFFCRHLVCIGINYVALDASGNPVGDIQFSASSAFVIEIHGVWLLVTAGHVFKKIDNAIKSGEIQIVSSSFADYFGPDSKVHRPTAFDYADLNKFSVDDDELGLDLGIIVLRPYFRMNMEANGIKPVTRENWVQQHTVEFDRFFLIGFP